MIKKLTWSSKIDMDFEPSIYIDKLQILAVAETIEKLEIVSKVLKKVLYPQQLLEPTIAMSKMVKMDNLIRLHDGLKRYQNLRLQLLTTVLKY